jgi:hypothetical protein
MNAGIFCHMIKPLQIQESRQLAARRTPFDEISTQSRTAALIWIKPCIRAQSSIEEVFADE